MKRNKKCCLRNLCFWQCRLIIGITAWLSAASFSPAFGDVYPSSVCPKTNCKWHDEYVIVTLPGEDVETETNNLLKALSKAIGVAAQVDVLKTAIKKLGPAGKNPTVIVVYICFDPTTGATETKKETIGAESVLWSTDMDKATGEDVKERDRQRAAAIKLLCGGNCCKVTPTPSPSPSPSPRTPTPTPKPSPRRITYTGQTPTPTPQEHGMVPRQPGKTGETCAVLIATGKIKVETSGTGETIGHIADLKIQNLTGQRLTCAISPMILESGSGKNQHYACPLGQTVALNPHQAKTVPMNGVCLNRNKPPVGKGVSGDLVINEANPSGPQNPNSHIAPADAGKLLRICTATYTAADQLQKSGALKALPYKDKQKQKDIVVQWSTWCDPRIAQITGAPPATKEDLRKVVYKQAEAKGPMSPETKKKLDQGIDAIFKKVELTTAKAKDLEKPAEEIPAVAAPAAEGTPAAGQPQGEPQHVTTVAGTPTATPTAGQSAPSTTGSETATATPAPARRTPSTTVAGTPTAPPTKPTPTPTPTPECPCKQIDFSAPTKPVVARITQVKDEKIKDKYHITAQTGVDATLTCEDVKEPKKNCWAIASASVTSNWKGGPGGMGAKPEVRKIENESVTLKPVKCLAPCDGTPKKTSLAVSYEADLTGTLGFEANKLNIDLTSEECPTKGRTITLDVYFDHFSSGGGGTRPRTLKVDGKEIKPPE